MKLKYLLVTSLIITLYSIIVPTICLAAHVIDENWTPKYYKMQATAYCIDGTTATGTHTRVGVAASKRSWFGKTVTVYLQDENGNAGELIGTYIIEDTGSSPIRRGKVIDIWMPTEDECMQFGRKNVIVYVNE